MTDWRNRIVGYGEEDPEQLLANPFNWRVHPQGQQDAFLGVVHDVGVVQNIIVNRLTGHVVDGHMRVMLAIKEQQPTLPITYVELSEQEEAEILATYDPISAMAVADRELFDSVLRQFNTGSASLQQMVSEMAATHNPLVYGDGERGVTPDEKLDIFLNATIKQIVLYFTNAEYDDVIERLQTIMTAQDLENHTQVFLKLLEHYEATAR